ncbi:TEL2, telomere maintenance protein 2 [Sparganum proliferum]
MTEGPCLDKALDLLNSANFAVDRDFHDLEDYIDNTELSDDEAAVFFLSQFFAKLFPKLDSPACFRLLLYATEHSRADIWLELLVSYLPHVTDCSRLALYLKLISAFFTTFSRLTPLYLTLSKKAASLPEKARLHFLIERTRCLLNVPTVISNALKGGRQPRIFEPELFYCLLMRQLQASGHDQLNAVLLSQCCLLGQGTHVWNYIFRHVCRSGGLVGCEQWGSALLLVSPRALESTLMPLLSGAPHPVIVSVCLSKLLSDNTTSVSDVFRVFHRLLLLRHFVKPTIPVNIFGCLGELVSRWHIEKPEQAQELYERTETELGFRILRIWADVTSLQRNSLQQRIYLSQSLVAWITLFRRRVPDGMLGDLSQSAVSNILSGITAHLSCNVNELRVLGMAVGEWLVSNFKGVCLLGDNSKNVNLSFTYEDNDAVKQVRPLFEPLPPFTPNDHFGLSEPLDEVFASEPSQQAPIKKTDQTGLDSDDDPDTTDGDDGISDADFSAFQPLPPVPDGPSKPMAQSVGWPFTPRKPRYLRECLDGLTASRDEGNEVALACFAHAEELIYKHRSAVDEISLNFAETLLHTEPPPCPYGAEVNAARHNALVALTVVAPKKTARYLTAQFTHSGLALNQRYEILACLTDAACILATDPHKIKSVQTPLPLKTPQPISDGKTRRFCTPASALARPIESENTFGPVAGHFFFPLLDAVGRLTQHPDTDPYAHLDDALLSRLIASLGSIYACARTAPKLPAMAEGLLISAGRLLNHPDAAVRRSSLSVLGVVLTVSPDTLFSANPNILLNDSEALLARRLQQLRESDADHECQELADHVLFVLRDKILELSVTTMLTSSK